MLDAKTLIANFYLVRAQGAQRAQTEQPCRIPQGTNGAQSSTELDYSQAQSSFTSKVCPNVPDVCLTENRTNIGFVPNVPDVPHIAHVPFSGGSTMFVGYGGDPAKSSPNPYMSERQFREAHSLTWDNYQIGRYGARVAKAVASGVPLLSAEHFSELLLWRDLIGDYRHACFECTYYRHRQGGAWGRCTLPNLGGLVGGQQEFFRLRRCEGFEGSAFK